jgi:hypothetical protein
MIYFAIRSPVAPKTTMMVGILLREFSFIGGQYTIVAAMSD